MAQATAICVCKHCGNEFEVSTIKMNRKLADSWEQWASTAYDCCYECEKKIRAEENARCAEEAKEMGLPALNGSQKQVAWAEKIRMDMMKDMERDLEKDNVKELILGVISVMVPGTMRGKKKPIPYIPTPLMVNGTFQVIVPISIHIYEIKFNKHRFNYLKLARCF